MPIYGAQNTGKGVQPPYGNPGMGKGVMPTYGGSIMGNGMIPTYGNQGIGSGVMPIYGGQVMGKGKGNGLICFECQRRGLDYQHDHRQCAVRREAWAKAQGKGEAVAPKVEKV